MSQITHLNADEMRALQGMSLEAKTLYVFELRRYADDNGITGLVRRHSYQSFREQLTVVPDWGSKQAKQPEITEKKIRVVLAELERHGLIEKVGGNLVFRLPMAVRDESVQKRKGGGRAAIGAEGRADTNTTAATVSGIGRTEGRADENAEEGRTSPVTNISIQSNNAREGNPHLYNPEAFAMFIGWRPSEQYISAMPAYNVSPDLMTKEAMADFYSYWIGEGRLARQGQWEHSLTAHLKKTPKKPVSVAPAARKTPAPENFREKNYSVGINADGSF